MVENGDILVSQNFFDPADQWTVEAGKFVTPHLILPNLGERTEKYIKDEFLTSHVYGCKNVLTNVSSSRKRVDLLMQIPVGAIPVTGGFFTKSRFIDLPPFTTTKPPLQYYFYFPYTSGETPFSHFPIHVASDEKGICLHWHHYAYKTVIAYASPATFNVVSHKTQHDKKSWTFISQMATNDEILKYLKY